MSEFDTAVEQERTRLLGLISHAEGKIDELNTEVSSHRRLIEALEAYERVKMGRVPGKPSAKKSAKQVKPAAILAMLKGSSGMTMPQILEQIGASSSSEESKALSVALMNLKLKGQVNVEDGVYSAT